MTFDEKIMSLCLDLAKKGVNKTFPNPMVGCVIVSENSKIIGKGYHKSFGTSHAEVNAIDSIKDKDSLKNATLYVNLEPCYHHGKTPPCVDLILKYKIKAVVIGTKDPNKKVNGKSIKKLKRKCKVKVGVLKEKCVELNRKFFINQIYNRPYIILKWSQTNDGFINNKNFKNGIQKISCNESKTLTHKWRSENDSIMIGKNTAIYDNPKLTVRKIKGKNPVRLIFDRNLEIPETHNIFNLKSKTIILTNQLIVKNKSNVEYIKVSKNESLIDTVKKIRKHNINSILVEGGRILLNNFINQNLWDEIRIFISNKKNISGVKAPDYKIDKNKNKIKVGKDNLFIIKNKINKNEVT